MQEMKKKSPNRIKVKAFSPDFKVSVPAVEIAPEREKEAAEAFPQLLKELLVLVFQHLNDQDFMSVRGTCLRFYFATCGTERHKQVIVSAFWSL